jgi:hypothetical protein
VIKNLISDDDENYMPMPPQNPSNQSVDNNQLGHDTDMNAFRASICNVLIGEID